MPPKRLVVSLRQALAPAFQDGKADIILGGHKHTFTRGFVNYNSTTKKSSNLFLVKPEMTATTVTQPDPFTPFYIVANTASTDQHYPLNTNEAVTLDKSESMDDQTYMSVDVSESSMTFTANNYLDGKWSVYDKYTINKPGATITKPTSTKPTSTSATKEETNVMNIAPNGTGYVWSNNSDASSNSNKAVAAAVNDNNTSTSASCTSSSASKWNGAGVTFSTSQNGITKVEFINGDISDGDGIFEGNCKLQFSTDGSTWSDSNWSISPDYPRVSMRCLGNM